MPSPSLLEGNRHARRSRRQLLIRLRETASASPSSIRVLIAVGVRLYGEGIERILASEPGISVLAVAEGALNTLAMAQYLRPSVILLDMGLHNSAAIVEALSEVAPSSPTIALAVRDDRPEVMTYAEAGVSGYLTRDATCEALTSMIRKVAAGQRLCTPTIASVLRKTSIGAPRVWPNAKRLTGREEAILVLLREGLANKEMAARLNLEVSTVKNHVHNLLQKLGAHRRGEASVYARRLLGDPDQE